jgi:hypothetical protein
VGKSIEGVIGRVRIVFRENAEYGFEKSSNARGIRTP